MSYEYDRYLSEHGHNVSRGFEWMKENITSIKEPLIVKYHNDSILSTEKMKSPELICFGFDEDKIKKYLQL